MFSVLVGHQDPSCHDPGSRSQGAFPPSLWRRHPSPCSAASRGTALAVFALHHGLRVIPSSHPPWGFPSSTCCGTGQLTASRHQLRRRLTCSHPPAVAAAAPAGEEVGWEATAAPSSCAHQLAASRTRTWYWRRHSKPR